MVTAAGTVVRVEQPSRAIPLDRDLLANLPGQPPAHVPLVCLDTETTGLATAAGQLPQGVKAPSMAVTKPSIITR